MNTRQLFDLCAQSYDEARRQLVPDFDELYGAAIRVIPFAADAPFHALDLGAGTGLLSAMVLEAHPNARLHLTDISDAMLAQARERFAGDPYVHITRQDHTALAASAEYDLVISALSIHHLENPDKQALFQKVHRALRPGGMFINIDQARAPSTAAEEQYEQFWLEDAHARGVAETALEQARERMRDDKNALLSDQLEWLSETGFTEVDCWYKRFRFVTYGGTKPTV